MSLNLQALFRPAAVAVLGASPRADAMGTYVARNLRDGGYAGEIYPIHPTATEVEGMRCYPDLASLPRVPDCAVVALSADKVMGALRDAAAQGVKSAVVFASGFAELGAEGAALQRQFAELHAQTGLLVCGPNCLGLIDVHARTALYSAPPPDPLPAGGVAVVSHSGSACIALGGTGRLGLSHMVSVGNAAVLDIHDYLAHFANDDKVKLAAVFMETVRDPEGFARAARLMRAAGKPIVLLRVGRSSQGAAATAAHTGSLAGSDEAYLDFFRGLGVVVANDMDEFVETCVLFESGARAPRGDGVAVLNVSGGEIALTCDLGEAAGLRFARPAATTLQRLAAVLPSFATPSNPLDVTGAAVSDGGLYRQCVDILAADPDVAVLAISQDCPPGIGERAAGNYRLIAQAAAQAAQALSKPVLFYSNVGGGMHADVVAPLHASRVAALQGARPALQAIAHWLAWHRWQPEPAFEPAFSQPQPAWRDRFASGEPLSEGEAKRFLADHGIATTRERLCTSAEQAVAAAREIGHPVVMKIESPDIAHKTEAGGVALGLADDAAVRAAFDRILADVSRHQPQARLRGVAVQEMVRGGIEMIAGTSRRAPFGPALVVGTGGIWVELVRDSVLALAPVSPARAHRMLRATRAAALLDGFRGAAPADAAALEALMVRLSEIAAAYADLVEAIEINPVAVLAAGQGVRVLDALVELRGPTLN